MTSSVLPFGDAPSSAFEVGLLMGALAAGFLCGLLPLALASSRRRHGLGVGALVTCVVAGVLGGQILAGPVALAFTMLVLALGKAPSAAPLDPWRELRSASWEPGPEGAASAFDAAVGRPPSPRPGEVWRLCPRCSSLIARDGAPPPSCRTCGLDLKPGFEGRAPEAAPADAPTPPQAAPKDERIAADVEAFSDRRSDSE
jgi:hypothetical protein